MAKAESFKSMNPYTNTPTTPQDKEDRIASDFAAMNRQMGGLSSFAAWPPLDYFFGYGPENGLLDISAFYEWPGLDYGWQGEFAFDEQPVFPDVPPYLKGLRR